MSTSSSDVGFPDGPRSELDRALERVVASAHVVQRTQGRLRNLLRANAAISDEYELPTVLRRIVEAAIDLVGAKYGAIGVVAHDGSLEQFIHAGMPDDVVSAVGHLPEGHGLLGVLMEQGEPMRLKRVLDEPRSVGFPAHHPQMDSFLGVPIRVRGEAYGNLYLAEQESGEFTDEDEELVMALAMTAGAAIDHARLLDESRRRQLWSVASAEITSALLSNRAQDSLAPPPTVWRCSPTPIS